MPIYTLVPGAGLNFVYLQHNITKIIWQPKRHKLCYSHLYLVQSEFEATLAVTSHFTVFELKRDYPHFIIFWDEGHSDIRWRKIVILEEFHRNFADNRILIGNLPNSDITDIKLVCIHCGSAGVNSRFLYPLGSKDISKH